MRVDKVLGLLTGGRPGIEEWNRLVMGQWEHPGSMSSEDFPSLRGADLSFQKLCRANLTCLNLEGANLLAADLGGARIVGTKLRGANMVGVMMNGTVISHSDLSHVDLRRSMITNTTIRATELSGANLSDARLSGVLWDSSLAGVIGLSSGVEHFGPSSISHAALRGHEGDLPEFFMRGCGLEDREIEFWRAQQGAVRFYSAFISYTEADSVFARRLHADLQASGLRCWFAPKDLKGGDFILGDINQAIRLHDKLIVVLSAESIRKDWVEHEVAQALERERTEDRRVLLPLMLDRSVLDLTLGWAKQITDASKPTGRLVRDFCSWTDSINYEAALGTLITDLRQ